MAKKITPIERRSLDQVQIHKITILPEDNRIIVEHSRGYEQDGAHVAVDRSESAIDGQQLADVVELVEKSIEFGASLYEALKAELYEVVSPTPVDEAQE